MHRRICDIENEIKTRESLFDSLNDNKQAHFLINNIEDEFTLSNEFVLKVIKPMILDKLNNELKQLTEEFDKI